MRKKQIIWLLLILGLALATRLPYLINQDVAFDFDHGRDALAVLDLYKLKNLKFVGPWTSIPGLFFGPAYYYLLAPLAWLSKGHPLSQATTLFLLGLVQIVVAFKYFGFWESLIVATAPAWTMIAVGASNAFPMTLVSWLMLIILKTAIDKKNVSVKQVFCLGTVISLGFHFSSALAIFYLIALPIILTKNRLKLNRKKIVWGLSGFLLVFLPQILFEIKNHFIELKGVMEYLKHGEKHRLSINKLKYITKQIAHELSASSLPEIKNYWLGTAVAGLGLVNMGLKKIRFKYWFELLILTIIPLIGFSGLHYNPWYVYGLFPIAVIVMGQIIKQSPKLIKGLFLGLLLLSPILGLHKYYSQSQPMYQSGRVFYKNKLEAIKAVYSLAEDQSFAVYTYTAEIYDYAYQYLFFWQALGGRSLPIEFSYKPGEISYVKEKVNLLSLFPVNKQAAEKIFLIINLPENKFHYPLQQWLDQLGVKQVMSKKAISKELEVWQVKLANL